MCCTNNGYFVMINHQKYSLFCFFFSKQKYLEVDNLLNSDQMLSLIQEELISLDTEENVSVIINVMNNFL